MMMMHITQLVSGAPALEVRVVEEDGNIVVLVSGELDSATKPQVEHGLSTASGLPSGCLAVDVSGLSFMGACGLSLFLEAHQHLVGEGRKGLVVRGAKGIVRQVFELTGLAWLLEDQPEPGPLPAIEAPRASCRRDRDLELARQAAGLSVSDLYVAYFALGGTADPGRLVAHLDGDVAALDSHQRDVAVHAVNERLADLGRPGCQLAYASA